MLGFLHTDEWATFFPFLYGKGPFSGNTQYLFAACKIATRMSPGNLTTCFIIWLHVLFSTFYLYFFWTLGSKEMYKSLDNCCQDQYKVLRSHIQSLSLPFLLPRQLQCLCPLLADYSVCHVHSSSNHGFDFVHLPFHSALGPRDIIVSHFSTVDACFGWWMRKPCRIWWYKQVLNKVWMI